MDDDAHKKYEAIQHYIRCHGDVHAIMVSELTWASFGFARGVHCYIDGVEIISSYLSDDHEFVCMHNNLDEYHVHYYQDWYDKDWYDEAMQYEAIMQAKSTPPTPPTSACKDTKWQDDVLDDVARKKYEAIQHYIRCHDDISEIMVSISTRSSFGFYWDFRNDSVCMLIDLGIDDDKFYGIGNVDDGEIVHHLFDDWYNKAMQYEATKQSKATTPTPPPPPPSAWCEDTK